MERDGGAHSKFMTHSNYFSVQLRTMNLEVDCSHIENAEKMNTRNNVMYQDTYMYIMIVKKKEETI